MGSLDRRCALGCSLWCWSWVSCDCEVPRGSVTVLSELLVVVGPLAIHTSVTEQLSYIQLLSSSGFSLGTFAVPIQLNIFLLRTSSTPDIYWHCRHSRKYIVTLWVCCVFPAKMSLLIVWGFWAHNFNQHVSAPSCMHASACCLPVTSSPIHVSNEY